MDLIIDDILYYLTGAFIFSVSLFVLYFKWTFRYWKVRGIPYLEPRIPWGSLQSHFRPTRPMGDEFCEIYLNAKRKGQKHIGLFAATSPVYMPVDKDLIKCVLAKDFNYFMDRGIYVNEKDEPIGAHLFALGGKKWKSLRSKFTPSFTSAKLKRMFQTVTSCGKILENYLLTNVNCDEPVEIKLHLGNYTTDIIGSCAFGIQCNSFQDTNPFRDMAKRILNRTILDDVKFALAVNFPKLATAIRMTWIPDTIKDFFTNVVVETVSYREKNQVHRNDFLQSLIDIKNNVETCGKVDDETKVTMDEIVAQSFVFFIAGYETSATTMAWTLYEMAANPDIQERVREEAEAVLEKYDDEITYESLHEMKFLGQCIEEVLRKYPPLPFLTRECVEDYKVPDTNVIVEKGTRVIIPVKGVHYDEEFYENPEVFNPDRFSEDKKKSRNPYSYLPFGEGPRLCLGMRFGIMQTKVGILSVLRNYRLSVSKKMITPLKLTVAFVPAAEGGLWLDMEKII